jgi:hypothetical protein
VHEHIFIAGRKHKAAPKLQRILSQPMLLVSCGFCALARFQVVSTQQVEQGSVTQPHGLIRFAFVVDKKRELDAGFLAEKSGVTGIA